MIKSYLLVLLLLLVFLTSCTSVKAYQKMYINDIDMQLSDSPLKGVENGFQTYREGVSGGNGGKTGGGCGCN
mgnify:CR=1 FL=1|jgi:hypothetical protein